MIALLHYRMKIDLLYLSSIAMAATYYSIGYLRGFCIISKLCVKRKKILVITLRVEQNK